MKNKLLILCFFFFIKQFAVASPFPDCKNEDQKKYNKCIGTKIYILGDKYVGSWVKGKRHGKGIYTWPNGEEYIGNFKNGKQDGNGSFTWINGEKYVGEWKKDKQHGKGSFTWPNGEKYVGDFKNGKQNGKGVFTWPNGEKYQGNFTNGKQNGKGIFTFSNGEKYDGDYFNGVMHGKGTYLWPNGEKYIGEWKKNFMSGIGKKTFPNKVIQYGVWERGKFNQNKTDLWLGNRYKNGIEIVQDYNLALKHYLASARGQNKKAMKEISKLYIEKKIAVQLNPIEKTLNFLNNGQLEHNKRNLIAYMWAGLSGDIKLKDTIKLDNEDLLKAQKLAKDCITKQYKGC